MRCDFCIPKGLFVSSASNETRRSDEEFGRSADVRRTKAQLAAAKRHHPEKDHSALRQELATAKLAAYVARTIAEAPPLSPAQLDRIAGLLRPPGGYPVSGRSDD